MNDIELNPLNSNLRHLLQAGVALLLVLFLAVYFIFINKGQNKVKNTTVYLQNGKLQVFDDSIPFIQFPDKIAFHFPYLVVVKPTQKISLIYNLELKKKEKEIKEIVLDYYKNNVLFNKGAMTFYNKQSLGVLCEKGFIKSQDEILCVTKQQINEANNKLIIISVKSKIQKDIYFSSNLITDVSVIGNDTYFGEVNINTRKNYVYVNNQKREATDIVSLIYELDNKPYFASFKSVLNNQKESYYLINRDGTVKKEGGNVLLYK